MTPQSLKVHYCLKMSLPLDHIYRGYQQPVAAAQFFALLYVCQGDWLAQRGGVAQGQPHLILSQLGTRRVLHQAAAQPGPGRERPTICEQTCVSVSKTCCLAEVIHSHRE